MRVNLVRAVSGAGLAVLALAGSGTAGVAAVVRPAASGSACQDWAGVSPLNPGTGNVLQGVAVVSACDAWAVGDDRPNGIFETQSLVEHWNGSAWTVVASPDLGAGSVLEGVQAASRTDIWAVGSYTETEGAERTLALHWNGTFWTQVATPSPGTIDELTGVRVLSADDAWAVGDSWDGVETSTVILHWNGAEWTQVASPSPARFTQLAGVAAVSPANAWAVGDAFGDENGDAALILHWNGAKWTQVANPSPGMNAGLSGVSAKSAADAWAVGSYYNGLAEQTLILHWNGTKWTQVASPDPGGFAHDNVLSGVAVASAGNAWAVGSYTSGPAGSKTLILHWDGSKWTQVASLNPGTSNQLNAVRAGPAGKAWAVGVSDGTALAIVAADPGTRTGLAGHRR